MHNNFHDMDLDDIYSHKYNANTYKGNIKLHFDNIMNLPFKDSDNKNRMERILNYFRKKMI